MRVHLKPLRAYAGPAGASAAAAAATPTTRAWRREEASSEDAAARTGATAARTALAVGFWVADRRCCTRAADWVATLFRGEPNQG